VILRGFEHVHAAHCESGAISALMRHAGTDISECMAFGLSGAFAFAFFPFIRMGGCPLTSYRTPPRGVIKGLQKRIGVRLVQRRYKNPEQSMRELDELVDSGRLVGCQSSVYWLPYFPEHMRFHFNAHNLLVIGREGDEYIISDPVLDHTVRCARADLMKARFAAGVFAPKGSAYWIDSVPDEIPYARAIGQALRVTSRRMFAPVPLVGVRGMRTLSRYIRKLPRKFSNDPRRARMILGSVIRMQEEIGTGGAGFRFLYASYLQEAAEELQDERLMEASAAMTAAGDLLREFALLASRKIKADEFDDCDAVADKLLEAAEHEGRAHRDLLAV
jgi:hypothetical protein